MLFPAKFRLAQPDSPHIALSFYATDPPPAWFPSLNEVNTNRCCCEGKGNSTYTTTTPPVGRASTRISQPIHHLSGAQWWHWMNPSITPFRSFPRVFFKCPGINLLPSCTSYIIHILGRPLKLASSSSFCCLWGVAQHVLFVLYIQWNNAPWLALFFPFPSLCLPPPYAHQLYNALLQGFHQGPIAYHLLLLFQA